MEVLTIQENQSLKAFNTFKLDVNAQYFCCLKHEAQLPELLSQAPWQAMPLLILGGGSNIVFSQDVKGLVIKNEITGISLFDENDDTVWLKVGAGVNWHQLVLYCIERGYAGIENLSLIPGTVGAAPIQNIGAYGVELESVFDHLLAFNRITLQFETYYKQNCRFAYRDSIFKHDLKNTHIITQVILRLSKKPQFHTGYGEVEKTLQSMGVTTLSIQAISDAIIHIRQHKLPDPTVTPNAGSFFKNPIVDNELYLKLKKVYPNMPVYEVPFAMKKIPAAWLIEQCGFKGKRIGKVGVHSNQALVLVNYDQGSSADLIQLAQAIQAAVIEKFGITLQTEVNIV